MGQPLPRNAFLLYTVFAQCTDGKTDAYNTNRSGFTCPELSTDRGFPSNASGRRRTRTGRPSPSVRRLALELGITFNTVAQAYRQLAEEGWLDLKHGRRATVIDRRLPSGASHKKVTGFQRRIRQLVAQMRAEGLAPRDIAIELRLVAEKLEA